MGNSNSCISKKKEKKESSSKNSHNDSNGQRNHPQQRQRQRDVVRDRQEDKMVKNGERTKHLDNTQSSHTKGASEIRPKCHPMPPPIDFYRERNRCLKERRLFEDSTFPANDSSLFFSKRPAKKIEWRRPNEITRDPHLFTDGHSRFDVVQGELGDCWMLAAVACLTLKDELFNKVVPRDQSFTEKYAGIFHFRFWQYGEWVDVVVDDRLPTRNGRLLYMHSESHNEFWSALLEKAYAKLHGSYEVLNGGWSSEAFEDFTGGLTEWIDLKRAPRLLKRMMWQGFKKGLLFECGTDPKKKEAILKNGLVTGHAYSITAMRVLQLPEGNVCLLRIRNPWGNGKEWKGAWSDRSSKWRNVPEKVKQEIDLQFRDDGEFWMSFEDVVKYFNDIEVCYPTPADLDEFYTLKPCTLRWTTTTFHGAWVRPHAAGAYQDFPQYDGNDPQYRIKLSDPDPEDDDDLCTVIVAVMQKNRRRMRQCGLDDVEIGFDVFKASGTSGRLTDNFKTSNNMVVRTPMIKTREMTHRFRVAPGDYIIAPFALTRNSRVEFMLRIFTNGIIESEEV